MSQISLSKSVGIVAIDSSTEACTVALCRSGGEGQRSAKLKMLQSDIPQSHAKSLLPMVNELLLSEELSLDQLDAILLTNGPGSFTGVRIGMSVAQGLAYGAQLPIIAIPSLFAIAATAQVRQPLIDGGIWVCALDARMNEIYWASYQIKQGQFIPICQPSLGSVESFCRYCDELAKQYPAAELAGAGHGFSLVEHNTDEFVKVLPDCLAEIKDAAEAVWNDLGSASQGLLNRGVVTGYSKPEDLDAVYLRNEITWEKRKRIRENSIV